jgi:SNF2-related domain/Helicase conserved C-terminal domain
MMIRGVAAEAHADGPVRWTTRAGVVELQWPSTFLASQRGRGLEPWIEDLREHDTADDTRLSLSFARWSELGAPPPAGATAEEIDLYQARHTAVARLLGLSSQRVSIESVGHVGAPELSFLVLIDGARIGEMPSPTPFPKDGSGREHALMPATFVVYQRLCAWNAKGSSTRAEQIVFLGELRSHLDRASAALTTSFAPFTYELDAHLREFRTQRPEAVALSWADRKNGAIFDLQVEQVAADGTRRPLDVNRLDPDNPIVELSSTEHVLLDTDMATVARVARKQRNKLRKHVEAHFHDPASLIPEGVSLEKVDLAAYSPRVIGFEPIKADRDFDIQSSGIQWVDDDGDQDAAFLRLFIAQPGGGVATLTLATPEAAKAAVAELDHALRSSSPAVIEIAGKRIAPTRPLRDRIGRELAAFEAGHEGDARPDEEEPTGRIAAKISDEVALPASGRPGADVDVRWDVVQSVLLPDQALKPHQRDGIAWMWRQYKRGRTGVLLADDMGLGKTLQISVFLALQRASEPPIASCPTLIVAPVILLDNWQDELGKFFRPDVFASLVVLHGDALRRYKRDGTLDVDAVRRASYVLTNYETLQSYQLSLLLVNWNVVVLDEAQQIKNSETARARAARGLKRRFGICSTGTPVENRLGDLWSLYDFLSPHDPFGAAEEFAREFETDVAEGVRKARMKLDYPSRDSSLLRRTKADALTLPPKTFEVHSVPMTPKQMELERHVIRRGDERGNILTVLQGLQKLYQHPLLLAPKSDQAASFTVEGVLAESPKLALCVELLREIRGAGEKALVFTIWTDMQAILVEVFKHQLGLPRVRIINGDPKQRRKAREYIREFSASVGFDVLVLSPLAAGTGLTITAANHVVHYGRWWNPAKEDQATDRAYRIGQTRPVRVHYPILHHPGKPDAGFDVKLHELVTKKRAVARDFLAPQLQDEVSLADLATLQGESE